MDLSFFERNGNECAVTRTRLNEICEIFRGPQANVVSAGEPGAQRFLQAADLRSEALTLEDLRFGLLRSPIVERDVLKHGDILFPTVFSRPWIPLVGDKLAGCVPAPSITVMRPKAGSPSIAEIANFLSSDEFFQQLKTKSSQLAGAHRITTSALSNFIVYIRPSAISRSSHVFIALHRFTQGLIRIIARDGGQLLHLEWRDLERIMATLLEGIGFDVELTPSSKDGGKDLILNCVNEGIRKSFIVEINHWPTGKKVQGSELLKFINVVLRERRESGLFLSTSGFSRIAPGVLEHLEHKRVRIGASDTMERLCKLYVLGESGLWLNKEGPMTTLFSGTRSVRDLVR